MKSRLAVSLLFILIAGMFTCHHFQKLRAWRTKVGRCTPQVYERLTARASALTSAIKQNRLLKQTCATADLRCRLGTTSPDGKTISFDSTEAKRLVSSPEGHTKGIVLNIVGSDYHNRAFDFITTAVRQVHEMLGLMRMK